MKKIYPILFLTLLQFFPIELFGEKKLNYFTSDPDNCYPTQVLNYSPGKKKAGGALESNRTSQEFGKQPGEEGEINFLSLGFGGSITLKFGRPVPNLSGTDIEILETSLNDLDCSEYKPQAAIYASKDGINWFLTGYGCQDQAYDLPAVLDWAQYFKIIDISDSKDFSDSNADGFHLDGLRAVQCSTFQQALPVSPTICITEGENGKFKAHLGYDNPNDFPVTVDIGPFNIIPTISSQTQPITFYPGKHFAIHTIELLSPTITWTLNENTVTASSDNRCIDATLSSDQIICEGSAATVDVKLFGEKPFKFTYTIGEAEPVTIENFHNNTYTFTTSTPGTIYLDYVSDGSGAFKRYNEENSVGAKYISTNIIVNEKPTATISNGMNCNSGLMTVSITGANIPFTLVYNDGVEDIKVVTSSNSYIIEGKEGRTYTLKSISDVFCPGEVFGSAIDGSFALKNQYCSGENIVLAPTFSSPSPVSYKFTSSGKGKINSGPGTSFTYIPASKETGEIEFTLFVEGRCNTQTKKIKTKINEIVNAQFDFPNNTEILAANTEIPFSPKEKEGKSYQWFINGEKISTSRLLTYSFATPDSYLVTLMVEKDGCVAVDTATIKIKSNLKQLYVPNIFSLSSTNPENKVVKVYGEGISDIDFKFKIYNKWGNLLYEANTFSNANTSGWDGKAVLTGEIQPQGVYSYTLDGKFLSGEKFHKTGTVTLVK